MTLTDAILYLIPGLLGLGSLATGVSLVKAFAKPNRPHLRFGVNPVVAPAVHIAYAAMALTGGTTLILMAILTIATRPGPDTAAQYALAAVSAHGLVGLAIHRFARTPTN